MVAAELGDVVVVVVVVVVPPPLAAVVVLPPLPQPPSPRASREAAISPSREVADRRRIAKHPSRPADTIRRPVGREEEGKAGDLLLPTVNPPLLLEQVDAVLTVSTAVCVVLVANVTVLGLIERQ